MPSRHLPSLASPLIQAHKLSPGLSAPLHTFELCLCIKHNPFPTFPAHKVSQFKAPCTSLLAEMFLPCFAKVGAISPQPLKRVLQAQTPNPCWQHHFTAVEVLHRAKNSGGVLYNPTRGHETPKITVVWIGTNSPFGPAKPTKSTWFRRKPKAVSEHLGILLAVKQQEALGIYLSSRD